MLKRSAALAAAFALAASAAFGQAMPDKKETFGGVIGPAALPAGSTAAYVYVGAPEVGGGYRQGIEGLEIEARASFDYFELAFAGEVMARLPVLKGGFVELAPYLGVGLVYSTGAIYLDRANFQYFGVRPRAGVVTGLRLSDTVRGLVLFDLPWTFTVSPAEGTRVTPLLGGGAEFFLTQDLSAVLAAQVGVDATKEPLGVTQVRPAYKVILGVGFRLF